MYYREEILFYSNNGNKIFGFLENKRNDIKQIITSEDENYILNVGQEQYINHLVDRLTIDTLTILEEDIFADVKEEQIPSEHFPRGYHVYQGKSYPRPVVYFYIPFSGNKEFFKMTPSTFSLSPPSAHLEEGKVVKRYIVFNENFEATQHEFDRFKMELVTMVNRVNGDIESHNSSLRISIEQIFLSRKEELLKRKQSLLGLSVPIKKKEHVPSTFSVPSVKVKKKISMKPTATTEAFTPDPTLDDVTYNDILTLINDMGKEFERKPSVYTSKGEEDLRDHFLMLLEPHFEGSATGETFNKSGKTDILLRHEGSNIFVGECKFWTGEKGFLRTIDQLLGYLTWRDSKTSVIMFVRNKEFTNVIDTVKRVTETHSNFVKFVNEKDHSWFNYIFHLNDDKNKEIKMAVMLYHIP